MAYFLTLIICAAPMNCEIDTKVFRDEAQCNVALYGIGEMWLTFPPSNPKARVWAACTPYKPT